MSELFFIADMNLFVNMESVISAEFVPGHEYVDDESQPSKSFMVSDKLTLVTKEMKVERIDAFDGDFLGVGSKNVKIIVSGPSARMLFEHMLCVSTIVSKDKEITLGDFPF